MKPLIQNIIFIFLFIQILLLRADASNYKIDSLENILQNANQKQQISIYNQLSKLYIDKSQDVSVKYARQALVLSRVLGQRVDEGISLRNLGNAYKIKGEKDKALDYLLKSAIILEDADNEMELANSYFSLGIFYVDYSYIDKAERIFKKVAHIYEKNNYQQGIAALYNSRGILQLNVGDFYKALEFFKMSLSINKELNMSDEMASVYNNIGLVYNKIGNYTASVENYEEALKIKQESKDRNQISNILNNIGMVYKQWNNYEKALSYLHNALGIKEELGAKKEAANILLNIGIVHSQIGDKETSMKYFEKALKINDEAGDKLGKAGALNNIGTLYFGQKNYERAISLFQESLQLKEEIGDNAGVAEALNNLGFVYKEVGKFEQAFECYSKSLSISRSLDYKELILELYDSYAQTYAKMNNFELALEFNTKHAALKDSLYNLNIHKQIIEIQAKYQLQNKENTINLLTKNQELDEAEIKRQKMISRFIIVGLLIVVLFSIFLLRLFTQKKKANRILVEQKHEIEEKNEELNQQKEEILAQSEQLSIVNKELEALSIVAQRTNNTVVIASNSGEIEWVNDGWLHLYGYKNLNDFFSLYGNNMLDMSPNKNIRPQVETCLKEKSSLIYRSKVPAKDGKFIWVQSTLTPIVNENNEFYKLVEVGTDITVLKEAEEEIMQRNEEIRVQSEAMAQINQELEKKNSQIIDSINYAKQIQDSLLPSEKTLKRSFADTFIFFKPKDIVSGDFYWFEKVEEKIFIAVIDCTGHGVPGAFMSMIGNTLLNEIVIEHKIHKPSEILDNLNKAVIYSLSRKDIDFSSQNDGMDISLCCIDKKLNKIEFACANQLIYFFEKDKLNLIEGDIYSIGEKLFEKDSFRYQNHEFNLTSDSRIYLFSDGFTDQFGGMNNKKFYETQLRRIIIDNKEKSFNEQLEIITSIFENWKGNNLQIDDITLLGIKV